jgi:hypothetical protein
MTKRRRHVSSHGRERAHAPRDRERHQQRRRAQNDRTVSMDGVASVAAAAPSVRNLHLPKRATPTASCRAAPPVALRPSVARALGFISSICRQAGTASGRRRTPLHRTMRIWTHAHAPARCLRRLPVLAWFVCEGEGEPLDGLPCFLWMIFMFGVSAASDWIRLEIPRLGTDLSAVHPAMSGSGRCR